MEVSFICFRFTLLPAEETRADRKPVFQLADLPQSEYVHQLRFHGENNLPLLLYIPLLNLRNSRRFLPLLNPIVSLSSSAWLNFSRDLHHIFVHFSKTFWYFPAKGVLDSPHPLHAKMHNFFFYYG